MEEHNDSLSYAIGLDMGMRMELEYKNVNHKMLNKGIDDYFSSCLLYTSPSPRD